MTKIFQDMGIYGISPSDETAILASILNAEPVLFIGPPGSAKTEITHMIGSVIREATKRKYPDNPGRWHNFHIYDTSKLQFEEIIGYPSPQALMENRTEYIPNKMTIWDKHQITFDEINRCTEERQSNIFEILRQRTVQGSPTKLLFIFSCMNPHGDIGTSNLSEALADRHLFFIHSKPFEDMNSEERRLIMERVGNFDAYGIKYWTGTPGLLDSVSDFNEDGTVKINKFLADQGDRLLSIIEEASKIYKKISNQYFKPVTGFIDELVERFKKDTDQKGMPKITGRRAGMMARALIAYRAIDIARSNILGTSPMSLDISMTNVSLLCLPSGIDKPMNKDQYDRLNQIVKDTVSFWLTTLMDESDKDSNLSYELYYMKNPLDRLSKLIEHPNLDNLVANLTYKDLLEGDLEISSICHSLYALTGTGKKHLFTPELEEKIRTHIISTTPLNLTYSEYLRPWEDELKALNSKYNIDSHELLFYCNTLGQIYINNVTKTESDAITNINKLKNMLKACKLLIAKKEEPINITSNNDNAKNTSTPTTDSIGACA